jgi:hypothetical protein
VLTALLVGAVGAPVLLSRAPVLLSRAPVLLSRAPVLLSRAPVLLSRVHGPARRRSGELTVLQDGGPARSSHGGAP